jgi:hypothetical protein
VFLYYFATKIVFIKNVLQPDFFMENTLVIGRTILLKGAAEKKIPAGEYLTEKDYINMEDYVFDFTNKVLRKISYSLKGVDLFDVMKGGAISAPFYPLIKRMLALERIMKKHRVSSVRILADQLNDYDFEITDAFFKSRKVPVEITGVPKTTAKKRNPLRRLARIALCRAKNLAYDAANRGVKHDLMFLTLNLSCTEATMQYFPYFRKKGLNPLIIAWYKGPKNLDARGIPYKTLLGYMTPEIYSEIKEESGKASEVVKNLDNFSFGKDSPVRGKPLQEALLSKVISMLTEQIPHYVEQQILLHRIISREQPKFLIHFSERTEYGILGARFAKNFGIASAWIEAGLIGANIFRTSYRYRHYSDLIFVKDNLTREMLIGEGIEPERVCSLPQKKEIILNPEIAKGLKEKFCVRGKKTVLYLNSGLNETVYSELDADEEISQITEVFDTTKELKDVNFIFRPHPNDNTRNYEKLIEKQHPKITLDRSVFPKEAISVCDLIAARWSTLAYDSIMMEKPVLLFDVGNAPAVFLHKGLCFMAGKGEFSRALKEILQPAVFGRKAKKIKKFLKDNYSGKESNPGFVWRKMSEVSGQKVPSFEPKKTAP